MKALRGFFMEIGMKFYYQIKMLKIKLPTVIRNVLNVLKILRFSHFKFS